MSAEIIPPQIVVAFGENDSTTILGTLEAVFLPDERRYDICDISVVDEYMGLGIAKAMLRIARQQAISLGAKSIGAAIVSREALDAIRSVFGEDSLDVRAEGSYMTTEEREAGDFHTYAFLNYSITD
jgi:ribosomal protein S18 acetylase RimI-like enzyme